MVNRTVRFIKTAITYFLGNILSKLITFFLIPLYTNRIVPDQYGNYDLAITIVTLFVSVAFFQIWDGMFRFSFDYKEDSDKFKVVSDTYAVFGMGVLLFVILFLIANSFLNLIYWPLAMSYGLVFGLQYIYTFLARVFLKNKLFVFSGTANSLTVAVSNVILIVGFNWDVSFLYVAQILGCLIQIIIIETNIKPLGNIHIRSIEKEKIIAMLKFSIPLCVSTISYWLLSGFTRFVINASLGSYENGIYATANTLANAAIIAVNVFQFAWNEMAYMSAHENDRTILYKKGISLLIITVTFGYSVICLLLKAFFDVFIGQNYWSAKEIVPLLMLGVTANAVAGFLGTLFMTEKKTGFILSSAFIAAGVNILFSKSAIERAGLAGAVIVLSIAFVVLMIVRLIQLNKCLHVCIDWKSVLSIIPVVISFMLYDYLDNRWMLLMIAVFLVLIYVAIVVRLLKLDLKSILAGKRRR